MTDAPCRQTCVIRTAHSMKPLQLPSPCCAHSLSSTTRGAPLQIWAEVQLSRRFEKLRNRLWIEGSNCHLRCAASPAVKALLNSEVGRRVPWREHDEAAACVLLGVFTWVQMTKTCRLQPNRQSLEVAGLSSSEAEPRSLWLLSEQKLKVRFDQFDDLAHPLRRCNLLERPVFPSFGPGPSPLHRISEIKFHGLSCLLDPSLYRSQNTGTVDDCSETNPDGIKWMFRCSSAFSRSYERAHVRQTWAV